MLDRRQVLLSAPFLYPAVRMLPTDLIPGPQHVDLTEVRRATPFSAIEDHCWSLLKAPMLEQC
jgi:hypothetical protein